MQRLINSGRRRHKEELKLRYISIQLKITAVGTEINFQKLCKSAKYKWNLNSVRKKMQMSPTTYFEIAGKTDLC